VIRSVALVALLVTHAYADPCEDDECKTVHPWSWAPIVSAMTIAQEAHDLTPVLGVELRIRHSPEIGDPLVPLSLGVGVQTQDFDTIEPSATLGLDLLHAVCKDCSDEAPLWMDVRLALGGGYAWTHDHDEPFGVARAAFGVLLARKDGVVADRPRYRLRSQLDIVFETHVSSDGWRVGVGIELDPSRLIQDMVAFSQ